MATDTKTATPATAEKTCAIMPAVEPVPSRTRADLINLRRQLKGTLQYIEQVLIKEGVKVEMTQ